jgi:aspartyl-tRNA(Asn)/glutamyl-tRNA(Gln) amidotransferase subunit C
MLNEVDTENVPPASDIANAENVLREDVVKPSMSREEFLKNAPNPSAGMSKCRLCWERVKELNTKDTTDTKNQ